MSSRSVDATDRELAKYVYTGSTTDPHPTITSAQFVGLRVSSVRDGTLGTDIGFEVVEVWLIEPMV